jgi:hypothetical protein
MAAIEIIAVVATISGLSGAVIVRWFRSRVLFVPIQSPMQAVRHDLSIEDVRRGLDVLAADARDFRPDCIVGINGGGAKYRAKDRLFVLAKKQAGNHT